MLFAFLFVLLASETKGDRNHKGTKYKSKERGKTTHRIYKLLAKGDRNHTGTKYKSKKGGGNNSQNL